MSEDDVHNEFVFSVGKFDTVRINQLSLIMRKHENFSHPYMLCHSFMLSFHSFCFFLIRNGTIVQGEVYFGAVDSRNQRKMHHLSEILMPQNKNMKFSLDTLRKLNRERKSR